MKLGTFCKKIHLICQNIAEIDKLRRSLIKGSKFAYREQ